jgi:hypothetical protein
MLDDREEVRVNIKYSLPQADLFQRRQPAILEGPRELWEGARTVIDFGCALLAVHNRLRDERKLRDATLVALLRRALVTAEGICRLRSRGDGEAGATSRPAALLFRGSCGLSRDGLARA